MLVVQVNWLGRDGRRAALIHGRTRPYRHDGEKSAKLELGSAFFMAGRGRRCGSVARQAVVSPVRASSGGSTRPSQWWPG